MRSALITGITGQTGSYLAELLLNDNYIVYGMIRRSSSFNTERINHLYSNPNLKLIYGDLSDTSSINAIMSDYKPEFVYNLGAMSHVKVSFNIPEYTCDVTGLGVVRLLESIRKYNPKTRFYQASSSELMGNAIPPQNENTKFDPKSPYGVAKLMGYAITKNYRESYSMFASNGILFNHESERRGETFVTRKITRALGRIYYGLQDELRIGNLDAKRDWGHAKDYCIKCDVPILTINGWKYKNEISVGDKIINFDANLNKLSEDIVLDKIESSYVGNFYVFEGRGFFLRCTENHRICYQIKSYNSNGGWSKYKFVSAKEFYDMLKTKSGYTFRLAHFNGLDKTDYPISDAEIYLLGAFAAEGCVSSHKFGNGSVISLSQSYIANESVYKKIENALNKLNLEYRKKNRNYGVTEWVLNGDSSNKIINLFGYHNIHILPRYIYNFSQRQAQILFDSLMDCDGCWGGCYYASTRYLLLTDFQTIATLAGYRTCKPLKKNDDYTVSPKTCKLLKRSDCYTVCAITKSKKHQYIQNAYIEENNTNNIEDVWCVSTKNGTIISRDNGCISISGNSFFTKQPL